MPDSNDLLVSWANGDVNDRNELAETAPNFGLYLYDAETGERTQVYDDPDMWELYAMPVRPRQAPDVQPSVLEDDPDPSEPAVLGSVDVGVTSLDETVRGGPFDGMTLDKALDRTHRVRIIEGFSSEIGSVREFGMTMHEGAAIVGEAPVYEDGSWEAQVPSRLPYHLQPIDKYGLSIRNQMLWIQAMPGEQRRCGGCHEARDETILPKGGSPTTLAQQAGPQDYNVPIPERMELPWAGGTDSNLPHANVQALFDAKCVECHGGGENDPFADKAYSVEVTTEEGEAIDFQVPYLDLSDRTITAYFDMEVVEYPVSYISLMYPSAMMGDATATGDMPPIWVVPGAARRSALVRKVNAQAEGDATDFAWDTPAHPEDVGVTLTREERMMLIRMADLGGQYFSRRNVEGAGNLGSKEY
jgi:mono/diheme cytochrome c family protein